MGPGRYFRRCDRRRHTNANADANCHRDDHANYIANADSHAAPDTYAETSPLTEASTHAAAAAINSPIRE